MAEGPFKITRNDDGLFVSCEFDAHYVSDEDVQRIRCYIDQIETDNAKLRELVRGMWKCISHANEQDWFYFERDKRGCGMSCTVNGEKCGLSAFADRMRELGIEVE